MRLYQSKNMTCSKSVSWTVDFLGYFGLFSWLLMVLRVDVGAGDDGERDDDDMVDEVEVVERESLYDDDEVEFDFNGDRLLAMLFRLV